MDNPEQITYFAQADFRNKKTNFGIKAKDRTRHVYVIGKTGMGKSTLLENMAAQDILNGEGMAFVDPHGSAVTKLLDYVPESRIDDVVYFAPFDTDYPVSFNVLEDVGPDKRHLVASGLMSAFKKIWVDAWSARMEYILGNILLALLEYPGSTLLGVNRMLSDKDYRKQVVDNIKDPSVKSFWVDEFAKYGDRYMQEAGAAIQNKIGQFTSNPLIRNIIGQPKSSFDVRKMMDEKKILLINLSKGQIGEANANLLGGMLITRIYLSAMSRADASPEMMKRLAPFYLYVDEFQSFASDSFADILSEARKYNLSLNIAHQYVEQMSEAVRAAVFGNVGTMIVFRVGAIDSEIFEKEFAPQFTAEDIVNLGLFQNYMRLMIDGVGSKPFSAISLAPIPAGHPPFTREIINASREHYARKRADVEEAIFKWHEPIHIEKKERIVRDGADSPRPAGETFGNKSGGKFSDNFGNKSGDRFGDKRPMGNRNTSNGSSGNVERSNYNGNGRGATNSSVNNTVSNATNSAANYAAPMPRRDNERGVHRNGGNSSQNSHQHGDRTDRNGSSERNDERQYVEPPRPKESLQSLLDKLSIEPERPKIVIEKTTEQSAPKITIEKGENPETISLSSLKKTRTPDPKKVDDLRALLQKVVPQQSAQPSASSSVPPTTPQPPHAPHSPQAPHSHAQQEPSTATLKKPEAENPKEVPEDVLRSILSS